MAKPLIKNCLFGVLTLHVLHSQASRKPKVVRQKQREVEQMAREHGDISTLKQVKATGKVALLRLQNGTGNNSASSGNTSAGGPHPSADEAGAAVGNGASAEPAFAHGTPAARNLGVKRKRLGSGRLVRAAPNTMQP